MADIQTKYDGAVDAITITLNSLADNAARESTHINNETDLFLDALVKVTVNPNGAPANEKAVYVWVYAGNGDGEFPDPATGSDAAITLPSPHNFRLIGVINTPANQEYISNLFSVAQAFGGIMPPEWGIIVENQSGQAFTAAGNEAELLGVLAQST
jgi:hypothetical protein